MSYLGLLSLPFTAFGAVNPVPVVHRSAFCPTMEPFVSAVFKRYIDLTDVEFVLLAWYYAVVVLLLVIDALVIGAFRNFSSTPVETVIACERLKAGSSQENLDNFHRILRLNMWIRIVGIVGFALLLTLCILFPGTNYYGYSGTGLLAYLINAFLAVWSLKELGGYPMQFSDGLYSDSEIMQALKGFRVTWLTTPEEVAIAAAAAGIRPIYTREERYPGPTDPSLDPPFVAGSLGGSSGASGSSTMPMRSVVVGDGTDERTPLLELRAGTTAV